MSGNQCSEESSKSKSIAFLPVEIIPTILFPYFSSAFLTNSGISGIWLRFLTLSSSENSDPKIPNGSWKEFPLVVYKTALRKIVRNNKIRQILAAYRLHDLFREEGAVCRNQRDLRACHI